MKTQTHQNEANGRPVDETDARLLSLFADHRDEDAFAELVRRHCGLVVGVCRRVLRNAHDIEDVFQATFLVLARDVQRIRERKSLTNWLYGVAYRLANLVARRKVRRRETELAETPAMIHQEVLDDLIELHEQQLFDEELQALPEKYRQPLVLHYLAGQSQQEVAEELGLTIGSVDGLLKRGRRQLRDRLARRGIAIGAALAAVHASQHVANSAELSTLIITTTQAGIAFTTQTPLAAAVSLRAAELAGKELATMSLSAKIFLAAGITLGATTLVGGFGLAVGLAASRTPLQPQEPQQPVRQQIAAPPAQESQATALQEIQTPPATVIPLGPVANQKSVTPNQTDQLAQNTVDEKYTNADEAYAIGAALYNARNFSDSQDPFEAALRMAPDDKYRIKVYRALLGAYRQLPEIDKFVDAVDFIITKSDSAAERSLARTDLLSFVFQRGKTNDLARRYEAVLTKDDKNVTALYVLSELYADLKRDPKRSAELLERLAKVSADGGEKLNVAASAKLAQQYVKQGKYKEGASLFEKIAPLDASLAAWHWKEAAQAWIKAKDNPKALAAAKAAVAAGPEKRGDLLLHFWHRALGQVFVATGQPGMAIEHFEEAIKSTTIEGYLKETKAELITAREMVADQK
ncbi:MAG: sigma-70 family RNA polymerase sigma factor [Planctomycetes bacterium]|nr:sigma-70 family RNA polymerase sigma factor [Planctomycetota bacterium]